MCESETAAESRLAQLAWQYRLAAENLMDWQADPAAFRGMCQGEAGALARFLTEHGIAALKVGGYYTDIDPQYFAAQGADEEDGRWKHWWVEAEGQIVDTTADQFHPNERQAYRVVIASLDDPAYEKLT